MQIYEQLLLEYIELPLILYIVYSSAILIIFVVHGILHLALCFGITNRYFLLRSVMLIDSRVVTIMEVRSLPE